MNKDLGTRITAAKPEANGNAYFVSATMRAVQKAKVSETFNQVVRKSSDKKESLFMRLQQLPKFALIALVIAATVTTGGVAYASYKLLAPKITLLNHTEQNDDKKRQYTVHVENCGVSIGGSPITNGVQVYEIANNSSLTEQQVIKVLRDTCAYQQVTQFARTHWKSTSLLGNVKAGQQVISYGGGDDTRQTFGKVTAKSQDSITIQTTVYAENPDPTTVTPRASFEDQPKPLYYPSGKVVETTYPISASTEYFNNQQSTTNKELRIGDQIYFVTATRSVAQYDNDYAPNEASTAFTAGIITTTVDPAYVQSAPFVGNPAYVGPVFQLVRCENNDQFLCLSKNNMSGHAELVYLAGTNYEGGVPKQAQRGEQYFKHGSSNNNDTKQQRLEGRVTKITNDTIEFISRGDSQKITVELPYDVVSSYNKNGANSLKEGDYIELIYIQNSVEKNKDTIKSGDVYALFLKQYQLPDGKYTKY